MNIQEKNNIRERWVYSLFELAHSEYQNRLWILADYENSIGDFSECVSQYFDDLGLNNGYSNLIADGIVSQMEYDIVAELHTKFKSYVEQTKKSSFMDINILGDPEWTSVTNIALRTWTELKNNTQSLRDKELMIGLEKQYLRKTPPNTA